MSALTLTILAEITANYTDSLGNISCVQKINKNGKTYAIRSKESLKSAIINQAGFDKDLIVAVDSACQKKASKKVNAANCRALEGGYMLTTTDDKKSYKRNSSFYLTDAVSTTPFLSETRFHNNLKLATIYANQNDLNLTESAKESGLMIYNYEFDKSIKKYSITIDLDQIGVDHNFEEESSDDEKIKRIELLLKAIQNLSLTVKGNLDNAEPIFIIGGISKYKSHRFDNLIDYKDDTVIIKEDAILRLDEVNMDTIGALEDIKINKNIKTTSVNKFIEKIINQVVNYYESEENCI